MDETGKGKYERVRSGRHIQTYISPSKIRILKCVLPKVEVKRGHTFRMFFVTCLRIGANVNYSNSSLTLCIF